MADPKDLQAALRCLHEIFECILQRHGIAIEIDLAAAGAEDASDCGNAFRTVICAMQAGC